MALQNGTTYSYSIFAYDESGNFSKVELPGIVPDITVAAPTITELASDSEMIHVTWTEVPVGAFKADSYLLEWGNGAPGMYDHSKPFTAGELDFLSSPTVTLTSVDGIVNDSTYYVAVTAIYGGESSPKATGTVAVHAPSGVAQVTNLIAEGGDAFVKLTWDADAAPDGYDIYYGVDGVTFDGDPDNPASPASPVPVTGNMSTYTISNLSNSTVYWFKVQAKLGALVSLMSETVAVATLAAGAMGMQSGLVMLNRSTVVDMVAPPLAMGTGAKMSAFKVAAGFTTFAYRNIPLNKYVTVGANDPALDGQEAFYARGTSSMLVNLSGTAWKNNIVKGPDE